MANMHESANSKTLVFTGKQLFLPPRVPFPCPSPAHTDYSFNQHPVSKNTQEPREGLSHHQRTTSESYIFEEQPSWLDDLLNEPETPLRKGHRRSSSDSFAYLNTATVSCNTDYGIHEEPVRDTSSLCWGRSEVGHDEALQYVPYCTEGHSFSRPQDRGWEGRSNKTRYPSSLPGGSGINMSPSPGLSSTSGTAVCTVIKTNEQDESSLQDQKCLDKREESHVKNSQSEADPKRAKQKFAQRSRVRKLQYIAELERNVQALQAEGSEVCAELGFLDQQNIILNLENKALKQRLDSLAQEHFIKHLQQETLEREIARLQALYLQQQPPQQPVPVHGRSSSRELDSQFANLSLKHKAANSARDPVTGTMRI